MHIEIKERETAIQLVDYLVGCGLCKNLSMRSFYDWFHEWLEGSGFTFSDGMTKICLFHPNLENCVIKVGYIDSTSIDHAELEYKHYGDAVAQNLDYYFPYTDFLCEHDGVKFFIQEIAECSEETITSDWYEQLSVQHEEMGEEFEPDEIWNEVWDLGDSEKIALMFNDFALSRFLSSHKIGDLHEGNFGFIGDRTVIIDFSGYHH
jgi:hypothetical protein